MPGTAKRIGRYQLMQSIGAGPTGEVYRAKVYGASANPCEFAVKCFHRAHFPANSSAASAIVKAAKAYESLDHLGIAKLSEVGTTGGVLFVAVEYVKGVNLGQLIQHSSLSTASATLLLIKISQALGSAHRKGVGHFGLSPQNIICTEAGDVKLSDFGFLPPRLLAEPAQDKDFANRLIFLAPEQLLGSATSLATDVFQLGMIAYQLLSKTKPYQGSKGKELASKIKSGQIVPAGLSGPLQEVLKKALAKDPEDRFIDAQKMSFFLERAYKVQAKTGRREEIGMAVQKSLAFLSGVTVPSKTRPIASVIPVIKTKPKSKQTKTIPTMKAVSRPITNTPTTRSVRAMPTPPPPIPKAKTQSKTRPRVKPSVKPRVKPRSQVKTSLPASRSTNEMSETTTKKVGRKEQTRKPLPVMAESDLNDTDPELDTKEAEKAVQGFEADRAEPHINKMPPSSVTEKRQKTSPGMGTSSLDADSLFELGPAGTASDVDRTLFIGGEKIEQQKSRNQEIGLVFDSTSSNLEGSSNAKKIAKEPISDFELSEVTFDKELLSDELPNNKNKHRAAPQERSTAARVSAAPMSLDPTMNLNDQPGIEASLVTPAAPQKKRLKTAETTEAETEKRSLGIPWGKAVLLLGAIAFATLCVLMALNTRNSSDNKSVSKENAAKDVRLAKLEEVEKLKKEEAAVLKKEAEAAVKSFSIESEPSGASLYLDGTRIGKTPYVGRGSSDKHRMVLILEGYNLYISDILGEGLTTISLQEVSPPKGPAGIKIRCKESHRYYIFVDDEPIGQVCPTERIGVSRGKHVVETYDPISDARRKFKVNAQSKKTSLRLHVD